MEIKLFSMQMYFTVADLDTLDWYFGIFLKKKNKNTRLKKHSVVKHAASCFYSPTFSFLFFI